MWEDGRDSSVWEEFRFGGVWKVCTCVWWVLCGRTVGRVVCGRRLG